MPELTNLRRARSCGLNGCIEVGSTEAGIGIRDSERPHHVLVFAKSDFAAFVQGVKDGEFDDLVS
jgi:hypothetical protein